MISVSSKNQIQFVITLVRHGQYDLDTHRITDKGADSMGHVAEFIDEITGGLRHFSSPANRLIANCNNKPLPRVDAIYHSGAERTSACARILAATIQSCPKNLGSLPWLTENFYPRDIYDTYHGGCLALSGVCESHFTQFYKWIEDANKCGVKHVLFVTHQPTMRALIAATQMVRANRIEDGNFQSGDLCDAEHQLRANTPYGITTVLGASCWQDFRGNARIIQKPFLPEEEHNRATPTLSRDAIIAKMAADLIRQHSA